MLLLNMTTCKQCGAKCLDEPCLDCRYRNGGQFQEGEAGTKDSIDRMTRHSIQHFRDGFTAEQLQQISPNER